MLGPLLFLLYINDLPNVSTKMKFFLFVDDTNIYFEADDMLKVEKVQSWNFENIFGICSSFIVVS